MKLIKGKSVFTMGEGVEVTAYTNPYENDQNKAMRGFVNISVSINGTFNNAYNSARVVETAKALFIDEPHQKPFKDKDGKVTSTPVYIASKALKDAVIENLKKEKLLV